MDEPKWDGRKNMRESLARQVWLGFKAGRLAIGGVRPTCPHVSETLYEAVWLAAVEVGMNPDFFRPPVEHGPAAQQELPSSSEEKLEAAMDEIVSLAGRVADLENALIILQPNNPEGGKP